MNFRIFLMLLIVCIFCSAAAVSATSHVNNTNHDFNHKVYDKNSNTCGWNVSFYNESNGVNNNCEDGVESEYNGSWEVEFTFNSSPGENSSLVIVENDESPVVSPVGDKMLSSLERNDYDLLKSSVDFGENVIHSISPTDSLDFSFSNLVPNHIDAPWDGVEPENSYYHWGSDSFLSHSTPWGTSLCYD